MYNNRWQGSTKSFWFWCSSSFKKEGYYVDGILINTTDPEVLDDENNIDMDKLKAK